MVRFLSALVVALAYAIPGSVIFVALFWIGLGQGQIPVLMYRGLVLACLAAILHGVATWMLAQGRAVGEHVILSAVSLSFAANVIFLVVFPVTIDRSVTVYLLGQLSGQPLGMTEGELNQQLVRQYVEEYRGVHRRMQEQIFTGNVRVDGERYKLTSQGARFIGFSRVVSSIFGLDSKFVSPRERSDQPQ